MTQTANNTLLNLEETTQPFDLATALTYMKEHGEFIRCKSATQDFYMYRDVQKRPAIVNGRRKFVDVETIWAFNQWGSTTTTINIADMLNEEYWIMRFDENGNPDWTEPQAPATPEV